VEFLGSNATRIRALLSVMRADQHTSDEALMQLVCNGVLSTGAVKVLSSGYALVSTKIIKGRSITPQLPSLGNTGIQLNRFCHGMNLCYNLQHVEARQSSEPTLGTYIITAPSFSHMRFCDGDEQHRDGGEVAFGDTANVQVAWGLERCQKIRGKRVERHM
jgi:hypothetical protein